MWYLILQLIVGWAIWSFLNPIGDFAVNRIVPTLSLGGYVWAPAVIRGFVLTVLCLVGAYVLGHPLGWWEFGATWILTSALEHFCPKLFRFDTPNTPEE